jgi:site-specific DNA-methyltransferase (adenine-specific)
LAQSDPKPLLVRGEAERVLAAMPAASIDCVVTSPPYWGQRKYAAKGLGLESTWQEYVEHVVSVFAELRRVLRHEGSVWLNIGDAYRNKRLLGLPWRVALELSDRHGFILRNEIIWNKVKGGPDNASDKLRNVHEHLFHFVRSNRYYYDADAIRSKPRKATVSRGAVVSATGVSGVRYRRQIELSTSLTNSERRAAMKALDAMLEEVRRGRLSDFRMIIRGAQRTTHSDSERVSGRAREIRERGFYFLRYHPNGAKPPDVWDIIPEDTQKRARHFAAYPEDLCRIPILATCPKGGVVLDPFTGTGTTNVVAYRLGRKSIGIDVSREYLGIAEARCAGVRTSPNRATAAPAHPRRAKAR